MAGSCHSFALTSPEAPHGSSVTDGFVSRMCWGGTLPASRTRGECFYCGQQPTSQPGQEENYPGVFLNLFHPIGGQMWPQCPEQLDSCRRILRTSVTMCSVGSWVWVGPVTAPHRPGHSLPPVFRVQGQSPTGGHQKHLTVVCQPALPRVGGGRAASALGLNGMARAHLG